MATGASPTGTVNNLFTEASNILAALAGAAAVLYIMWYGIQYITAGGSPDKAKQARAGIVNGIIGIVIVVAAYAIVRLGTTIASNISNILT